MVSDKQSSTMECKSSDTEESSTIPKELAKGESIAVFRLRGLVIAVLAAAAVAVSFVVYFTNLKAEKHEFKSNFVGQSEKILRSFQGIISDKIAATGSLGISLTAYAIGQNVTWPFVTMNNFQQRAASKRSLSKSLLTQVAPIVSDDDRAAWEKYSVENDGWLQEGQEYQERTGLQQYLPEGSRDALPLIPSIFQLDSSFEHEVHPGPGPYVPFWQMSPVTQFHAANFDVLSWDAYAKDVVACIETKETVLGSFTTAPPGDIWSAHPATRMFATLRSLANRQDTYYKGDPMSNIYFPVFDTFEDDKNLVAMIFVIFNWVSYFEDVLPDNIRGITVVLSNTCNEKWTYEIDGSVAYSVGEGDLHEAEFHDMAVSATFDEVLRIDDGSDRGILLNQNGCDYKITVYPTKIFKDQHTSCMPVLMAVVVALVFLFAAFVFFLYDELVERRQRLVMTTAVQSHAIVSSLFPETVRDRLMTGKSNTMSANKRLKSFLNGGEDDDMDEDQPIADLFPNATVLFCDIAGFTAWSSTRDPSQVFVLLQKLYQAFDRIATKRKIFKVETIGDCYVAVAGVPYPIQDHAVAMCRFAWECNHKVRDVMRELEVRLGPDTGDLSMRFGLNSGPVTAGVLRGERSRFQLFGDTVVRNTGTPNMVHISSTTAALLKQCGKGHWVSERDEVVQVKGKGTLKTFWMVPKSLGPSGSVRSNSSNVDYTGGFGIEEDACSRNERLVDWIVELLLPHVKQVVAKRNAIHQLTLPVAVFKRDSGKTNLDEVVTSLVLPKFNPRVAAKIDPSKVEIPQNVIHALRYYVLRMSQTYNQNPFHNFEHACHVTMSVDKFLKRIVAPDMDLKEEKGAASHQEVHNYTHGINSDPMTLMAIVFSGLIHDSDHRGVSNTQLRKENPGMDELYNGKSVAEQNSLDIAWDMLMEDSFSDLRSCLFANQAELHRFRQLIVNVVLATDIFDKELNDLRKMRWNNAFGSNSSKDAAVANNLRATIVIEHIIQASDVSHTMQHWHVYRKWNSHLFEEMYIAYRAGRMDTDPASFWYKGELGFFDNYVIPLAKKLKDCNVFGVSSDECLNYALLNRAEWETRGKDLVKGMVVNLEEKLALQDQSVQSGFGRKVQMA